MSEGQHGCGNHVVVIPHFVLVSDILTILPWILLEGSMTESTVHCAIEFDVVLGGHYDAFVVILIVERLHLELADTRDEHLHTV